jgi:Endonuclease/Exonuclease/phosphatase family
MLADSILDTFTSRLESSFTRPLSWQKTFENRDDVYKMLCRPKTAAPKHVFSLLFFAAMMFVPWPIYAQSSPSPSPQRIRIATFNASLHGKSAGDIHRRLSAGNDRQAIQIAAIIRHVRPDVLLINELDFEPGSTSASLLTKDYFVNDELPLADLNNRIDPPIRYDHVLTLPSNTGMPTGMDLDRDGKLGEPEDAAGFGEYPGQYAFAILSRLPIQRQAVRTFADFKWSRLPDALVPTDPETGKPFYSDDVWHNLRLSSKNHVDATITWGDTTLHLLASHPTPPVFDGPEDRNGCRNHDEIRFWTHYLNNADFLIDDKGQTGGLPGWQDGQQGDPFVILGDLNSDPDSGDSRDAAIVALIGDPRIRDAKPKHDGKSTTAKFRSGEMRVDYVLPGSNLKVVDSGVFWPSKESPTDIVGWDWIDASDHRLVWIDVELAPPSQP